jgi:hypothetical protein
VHARSAATVLNPVDESWNVLQPFSTRPLVILTVSSAQILLHALSAWDPSLYTGHATSSRNDLSERSLHVGVPLQVTNLLVKSMHIYTNYSLSHDLGPLVRELGL